MKLRRTIVKTVIAVVVVAGLVAGFRWWRSDAASEAAPAEAATAKVTRGPLRQVVQSNGRVVSNLDVEIKCRASGEVIKLPFDVSDKVTKGELLLELDPVDQQRLVQQAQANLAASQARLEQSKASLAAAEKTLEADRLKAAAAVGAAQAHVADARAKAKRERDLLEKKFSSPEEVETAETTAVQAEQDLNTARANVAGLDAQEMDLETARQEINLSAAEVDSDKIALQLAERQLSYTKVQAPIDGVVSTRTVQIGQIIASGISNVAGGTTVLTLSDLSHIYILAAVDESDIGFVELGQMAEITADSFPRTEFTGKVDRIATTGVNLNNVVTFEVRIEVLSENKTLLKPEMTANVGIIVADKEDVLQTPVTAIVREGKETFATLARGDGTPGKRHSIEIGITDFAQTEIVAGLKEGDEVVLRRPEEESRWRSENQAGRSSASDRQRMMMRTVGGGRPR